MGQNLRSVYQPRYTIGSKTLAARLYHRLRDTARGAPLDREQNVRFPPIADIDGVPARQISVSYIGEICLRLADETRSSLPLRDFLPHRRPGLRRCPPASALPTIGRVIAVTQHIDIAGDSAKTKGHIQGVAAARADWADRAACPLREPRRNQVEFGTSTPHRAVRQGTAEGPG